MVVWENVLESNLLVLEGSSVELHNSLGRLMADLVLIQRQHW